MLTDGEQQETSPTGRRHPFVWALAVIVFAECALMVAATGYLLAGLLGDRPESYAGAVALVVVAALAAVWLGVVGVGVLRRRPWVRGAVIVWQFLQVAVAAGTFQGLFARPDVGWLLLVPAIVAFVLVFTKPVIAAVTPRESR